MNDLTHLDLFSGIGGFALAAQRAGFRTVGFSEVEPYACRVLAERFPGVPNLGDVRNRSAFAGVGKCTIVSGGFPCQPTSVAGKRLGPDDDRWLWPAALDIVSTVRPNWFIGENVLGLVSMGLDGVLSDLARIGYATQSFVIPACARRAKQWRNRVWVVGSNSKCDGIQGRAHKSAQKTGGARNQLSRPVFASVRDAIPAARVYRADNGVPVGMDAYRNRALGNAIVPQVAEPFFHWIAQIERGELA